MVKQTFQNGAKITNYRKVHEIRIFALIKFASFKISFSYFMIKPYYYTANVRLAGGTGLHEGRVEVYYNGKWGTVCDDGWDLVDAEVTCRELGYPGAVSPHCCAHFGQGPGTIWLDDVRCRGNESSVSDCLHSDWGSLRSCVHGEDAGVTCKGIHNYNKAEI